MNTNNSVCPNCGKEFECGAVAGNQTCWCFSIPNIIPVGNAEECLCPDCLKKMIVKQEKKSQAE